MDRAARIGLATALLVTSCLGLAACAWRLSDGPDETPSSLPEPARPVSTLSPAVMPRGTVPDTQATDGEPTGESPVGWVRQEMAEFVISLPADWRVCSQETRGDSVSLDELFRTFKARNPELAAIVGGEPALHEAVLCAFDPEPSQGALADSLNIRRTTLGDGEVSDPAALLAPIEGQFRQLGFDVSSANVGTEINGHPAARIAFSLSMIGADGGPVRVGGYQYLIAAGDDLWILTYTTVAAPVAEQSARSFRVR